MSKILLLLILAIFTSCTSNNKIHPKCYEKPKPGFCKASFQKYYFDNKQKECKVFYWGGCSGQVPFHEMSTCQKTCEK